MTRTELMILPVTLLFMSLSAQTPSVHAPRDARMKTDLLVIMAHPDDETAIGSYLAKYLIDEKKTVSVVYCTRGTGGGNSHGSEQGKSMGAIREIEVRTGLAGMGITNVWFLEGADSPGQDVFRSLSNWGHGSIQEDVVRLVRLTRPEVIITWLPGYVAGENHGDHQAAGVIATEAYTLAADPSAYPAQIAHPREPYDINNSSEGLTPWQPKKIYYVSDASRAPDLPGPTFDITSVSRMTGVPYHKLAMAFHRSHLTQGDVSDVALQADRTGDDSEFVRWLGGFRLIFGKAAVVTTPEAGVFDDLFAERVPAIERSPGEPTLPLIRLGGAFEFYREFWRTHNISHLEDGLPAALAVSYGSYTHIPLILRNGTNGPTSLVLTSTYPEGWSPVVQGDGTYHLASGQEIPVQTFFFAPATGDDQPYRVEWNARVNAEEAGTVTVTIYLKEWTLPQ